MTNIAASEPEQSSDFVDNTEASTSRDTQRIVLCVEYDGSAYSGWQTQKSPNVTTVQETLERALSKVANHPVKLICAGRTDAGVHASGQIVHFDAQNERKVNAWVRGGNSFLPAGISIVWAKLVEADFHARFSATSRRYRYLIYNNPIRPGLMKDLVTAHYRVLDAEKMSAAAQFLVGTFDFTSYRGVACQSASPIRSINSLTVKRFGEYVLIDIEANAFLLHMVRNIAGVLLEIGEGIQGPEWAKHVLEKKDRSCAGITASPKGLYLVEVGYPAQFGLPKNQLGPAFLRNIFNV